MLVFSNSKDVLNQRFKLIINSEKKTETKGNMNNRNK